MMKSLEEQILQVQADHERLVAANPSIATVSWSIKDADLEEMELIAKLFFVDIVPMGDTGKHRMMLHNKKYFIHIYSTVCDYATA